MECGDAERVAVLTRTDDLVDLPNTHPEPDRAFRTDLAAWWQLFDDVELVLHTHPDGREWPSRCDMAQAIAMQKPWAIIPRNGKAFAFGPGAPEAHVWTRPFRFGVTDCYGLCRDVLRLVDVHLSDYPREWGYWRKGRDVPYYERHCEREGMHRIAENAEGLDLQPGDMLLFRLHSQVANHAGVYLGEGRMIHHLGAGAPYDPTRPVRVDSIGRWRGMCSGVLRHVA